MINREKPDYISDEAWEGIQAAFALAENGYMDVIRSERRRQRSGDPPVTVEQWIKAGKEMSEGFGQMLAELEGGNNHLDGG